MNVADLSETCYNSGERHVFKCPVLFEKQSKTQTYNSEKSINSSTSGESLEQIPVVFASRTHKDAHVQYMERGDTTHVPVSCFGAALTHQETAIHQQNVEDH